MPHAIKISCFIMKVTCSINAQLNPLESIILIEVLKTYFVLHHNYDDLFPLRTCFEH